MVSTTRSSLDEIFNRWALLCRRDSRASARAGGFFGRSSRTNLRTVLIVCFRYVERRFEGVVKNLLVRFRSCFRWVDVLLHCPFL